MQKTDPASELTWQKKFAFSIVLAVFVLGSMELVASFYLRWTQGYDGKHLLQYEFDPYKNILPTRDYEDVRGVKHNSVGFRSSREIPRRKPPNTYRIFLMGASTAYGTGGLWPHIQRDYPVLKNTETIDAYLESILQDRFSGITIEVVNAAIPSTWTHHHLIYLNQSVLNYDPDMVLFLDGFNDFFWYENWHDQFSRYAYGEHSRIIMGPPTLRALTAANGWWFFRKSALVHALARSARELKLLLSPDSERVPIDVDHALAGLRDVYAGNALKMIERTALILAHEGVTGVFMLQPLLILEREREREMPEVERQLFEFNVRATLPNYEEFMRRAVPIVSRMEAEVLERIGSTFLDLTEIYRGEMGQMFTDYAHLTPHGNRILAEHIAERIATLVERDLELIHVAAR